MRSLACPERRVVLGLGVCLVLALALPGALAASTPQPSQAAWALTPSPAIAGPFTRGDAAWRRGQRAERARIAALHSGGARRARRQSRSRFGKLHRKEVVRLARRTFPIQTRARLFDGSAPGAGARVVEQRHGRTGLVKDANGTTSLLTSSLPLETKAEDGTYAPVDLSLVTRDKVLRTANSLAPLEISREGAGRVALPESGGLAFELQGADSRSAQVVANRAYFADVATDTDEVVTPTPTGAELSLQIRSAAAPEWQHHPTAYAMYGNRVHSRLIGRVSMAHVP